MLTVVIIITKKAMTIEIMKEVGIMSPTGGTGFSSTVAKSIGKTEPTATKKNGRNTESIGTLRIVDIIRTVLFTVPLSGRLLFGTPFS